MRATTRKALSWWAVSWSAGAVSMLMLTGCGTTVADVTSSSGATAGSGLGAAPAQAGAARTTATGTTLAPGGSPPGQIATGSTSGQSGANGTAVQVGPAGVAATGTGPIQIGFTTTRVSNAQSLGINVGSTYSDQQIMDALVKETNKAGGIGGRRIVPVYASTDTGGADWSSQFQAACANFTQDHHVAAVLSYIFVWFDSFEQCLAKAGVSHLSGGYQPGDIAAQHGFPTLFATAHPSVDIADLTVIDGAERAGLLTRSTNLGVLYDTCAHGDRAFAASATSRLRHDGIHFEAAALNCANGAGDAGNAAAQVQNAVLQFHSHGVTTVWSLGVELLLFMADAESQHWNPTYLTSIGGAAYEGNVTSDQLKNLHGFGWFPAADVDPQHQPSPPSAAQRRCLSMLKAEGITPTGYNDYVIAYTTCDSLSLYAAAVANARGRVDATSLIASLHHVVTTFRGAATYDGLVQATSRQHGGAASYRQFAWNNTCSCFTYTGPARRLPA